uniref:NADH-ubiquinone oxidoreductase chain 2 n=1 Tax=Orthonychiurus folsomi TaxID=2581074 RepID=A0A650DRB6_9HEXA|nr:NADH dehydrogenase subunit 2 [Orthonychiurus folsomi]
MLINLKNNLYTSTLITGTLIAISSSSWFSCWLGLEINLMSLIPLIINKINPSSSEASIKYFITQALASIIIIMSASFIFFKSSNNFIEMSQTFLMVGIGMKIGAAPLHFWLPQVIQTSEWHQIIIILTWQKIAPMCLLMFSSNFLIFFLVIASCFTGVSGALNQTSIKKIIVYSSILHSAWMMSALNSSETIWWFYFIIYSMISASVIISFYLTPILSVKQLFNSFLPTSTSLIILMNFFSLGGIPPFLGFLMKIVTLTTMISLEANLMIIAILVFSSLLALLFYTRLIFSSSLISLSKINLNFKMNSLNSSSMYFLIFSVFGNICTPIILTLIL